MDKEANNQKKSTTIDFYRQADKLFAFVEEHRQLPSPDTDEPLCLWLLQQITNRNLVFIKQEIRYQPDASAEENTLRDKLWFEKAALVKEFILTEKKLPTTQDRIHDWLHAQFKAIKAGFDMSPAKKAALDDLLHAIVIQNVSLLRQKSYVQGIILTYKAELLRKHESDTGCGDAEISSPHSL